MSALTKLYNDFICLVHHTAPLSNCIPFQILFRGKKGSFSVSNHFAAQKSIVHQQVKLQQLQNLKPKNHLRSNPDQKHCRLTGKSDKSNTGHGSGVKVSYHVTTPTFEAADCLDCFFGEALTTFPFGWTMLSVVSTPKPSSSSSVDGLSSLSTSVFISDKFSLARLASYPSRSCVLALVLLLVWVGLTGSVESYSTIMSKKSCQFTSTWYFTCFYFQVTYYVVRNSFKTGQR